MFGFRKVRTQIRNVSPIELSDSWCDISVEKLCAELHFKQPNNWVKGGFMTPKEQSEPLERMR